MHSPIKQKANRFGHKIIVLLARPYVAEFFAVGAGGNILIQAACSNLAPRRFFLLFAPGASFL